MYGLNSRMKRIEGSISESWESQLKLPTLNNREKTDWEKKINSLMDFRDFKKTYKI